jgi:hypothetical protein
MMIHPLGKLAGDSSLGKVYQNSKGVFWVVSRLLSDIIEARVTNGRGYIDIENPLNAPYAENSHKKDIDPRKFCYKRLENSKFLGWEEDLAEGHPDYSCLYHQVIHLD